MSAARCSCSLCPCARTWRIIPRLSSTACGRSHRALVDLDSGGAGGVTARRSFTVDGLSLLAREWPPAARWSSSTVLTIRGAEHHTPGVHRIAGPVWDHPQPELGVHTPTSAALTGSPLRSARCSGVSLPCSVSGGGTCTGSVGVADQRREMLKERHPQMSWLARTLVSSGLSLPIRVPWGKVLARSGLLAAAVAVAVAAVYVIFWPVSDLIARHDVGAITGRGYGAALQQARDAARGRLVAFGAGLFAAGALIYTARNFSLTRQGQVTDRYTKAIDQLGSDKGLDVRIGGIYALERIAHDSPPDHPTIMDVLATFIRDHSSEQWPPAEPGRVDPPERATRPDVQAALTVIGRRNPRHDRRWSGRVDLHSAVLTRADLRARTSEARTCPAPSSPARTSSARTFPARTSKARTSPAPTSPAPTSPARTSEARTSPARTFPARTFPARTSSG